MTRDADTSLEPLTPTRWRAIHDVEAPTADPVEIGAVVERAGRSATTVSLRLEQHGRPVALALGSCATWRDGEPEWAERAPEAPPPDGTLLVQSRQLALIRA